MIRLICCTCKKDNKIILLLKVNLKSTILFMWTDGDYFWQIISVSVRIEKQGGVNKKK
jgi:hypothetical protein